LCRSEFNYNFVAAGTSRVGQSVLREYQHVVFTSAGALDLSVGREVLRQDLPTMGHYVGVEEAEQGEEDDVSSTGATITLSSGSAEEEEEDVPEEVNRVKRRKRTRAQVPMLPSPHITVPRGSRDRFYPALTSGFVAPSGLDWATALPARWPGLPSAAELLEIPDLEVGDIQPLRSPLERVDCISVVWRLKRNRVFRNLLRGLGVPMTMYEIFNSSIESLMAYMTHGEYPLTTIGKVRVIWAQESRRLKEQREKKVGLTMQCHKCGEVLQIRPLVAPEALETP
jgi:hypothetical protein